MDMGGLLCIPHRCDTRLTSEDEKYSKRSRAPLVACMAGEVGRPFLISHSRQRGKFSVLSVLSYRLVTKVMSN